MKRFFSKIISKAIHGALIIGIVVGMTTYAPRQATAQITVTDILNTAQSILNVINTTATSISEYYNEYKESVLDGLAWAFAKSILQSMTSDIVAWINNGFEGNPAFVSNPGGFFLDAADQFTGQFLGNGGPLDALCSPFSIDIRLSLSLNLAQRQRQRYACTLSTVINNARNARVNVSADVNVNGQTVRSLQASNSVEGFMSGDFSQGGWAAFTALTTQPQNNVYGAYIQAESEMSASIARQGANIQADLTMGSGFMSWEKCTKIYEYHQDDAADSGYGQQLVETTPDARIKSGKDGMTTIESCHRETPGSVIGSSLNKQLGIPADSLNMADEINEIISALFSQLVVQVLNGGLYSSTNAPYVRRNSPIGNPDSALGRIRGQSGRDFEATQVDLLRDARRVASTTAAVLPIRKEAFEIVDAERNSYLALISCFEQTGATTTQGYERLTRILEEEIDPFHADLKESYEAAEEGVAVLQQIVIAIESAESTTDLIEPSMEYSRVIRGTRLTSPIALQSAKEDLRKAKNKTRVTDEVVNWRSRLNEYKDQCTLPAPATTTP